MSGGWIQASVSRPCTASSQSRWRTGAAHRRNRRRAGAADRLEARVPEPVHRPPLLARAIVQLAQRGRCGPRARRHVGAEPGQCAGFFQYPQASRPVATGMPCRTTARHKSRRGPTPPHPCAAGAQLFDEQRVHVPGENAARGQLFAIPRLGQVRFAPQPFGGVLDRLFERQVLEGVQGVVVDEDADGPLCRQHLRQVINERGQRMARRADIGKAPGDIARLPV